VKSAKIAAKRGRVYVVRQDDVSFEARYKGGFRTVHVRGSLYELIAPTAGPPDKTG